ncbi:MAG TPA: hypothetical protein ENJ79_09775 [Gammaproteobacteria bacterium]|nr:hypothetical protein [Gammaproteobacteria bacterium]
MNFSPKTEIAPAPRIGLVSNPHSRRNRRHLARVEARVAQSPGLLHHITRERGDLGPALESFAREQVQVLAISGGDGTATHVFRALFEHRPFESMPAIALLPGGTTNMNARDCGLHGSLLHAVERLCRWAEGRPVKPVYKPRPLLRIEGAQDQPALYGMFFGTGTIVAGIDYCLHHVHNKGLVDELGPGVALARVLWGLLRRDPRFATPVHARLAFDEGEDQTLDMVLCQATTLERLVLGMHPWWGGEKAPLHCTWARRPLRHLLRRLPRLLRGRPVPAADGYFSRNAHVLELDMDAGFAIDGEMYRASRAHGPLRITATETLDFVSLQ